MDILTHPYIIECLAEPDEMQNGYYRYAEGRIVPFLVNAGLADVPYLYRAGGETEDSLFCVRGTGYRLINIYGVAVCRKFTQVMEYLITIGVADRLCDEFYYKLALCIVQKRFDPTLMRYYEQWNI